MINGYKVAALCVSEIQNENTQSMIDPLYQSLLKKNWRCLLFNTTTDLFRDTAFDRGEASIFQLMDFSVIDVVVIYTQCLKCRGGHSDGGTETPETGISGRTDRTLFRRDPDLV